MDNFQYIQVNTAHNIIQAFPESLTGDTVTIAILRLSDEYTWNFSTTAMTAAATTGTMTFISGILWKQSFTPPTEDSYICTITNSTLGVSFVQVLKAQGNASPAGTTGNELTTLANVKAYFVLGTDTGNDTLISTLIVNVTKEVQNYTRRKLVDDDYVEYYNGHGDNYLETNEYPINSIASIYDDIDRAYGASTLISSADYIFIAGTKNAEIGKIIYDGSVFDKGDQNIKISYNAGYATIPSDLEHAAICLVGAYLFESMKQINISIEGEQDVPSRLRKNAYKIFDRYRNMGR